MRKPGASKLDERLRLQPASITDDQSGGQRTFGAASLGRGACDVCAPAKEKARVGAAAEHVDLAFVPHEGGHTYAAPPAPAREVELTGVAVVGDGAQPRTETN